MSGSGAIRFTEPGARWRAVAVGPALCLVVLLADLVVGRGVHWIALGLFALLLAGITALQVAAARRHVSVELTDTALRNGVETIPVSSIAALLPERAPTAREHAPWESARSLGELVGVPRRRHGIGLRLTTPSGGDTVLVQAWARDHARLRTELESVLSKKAS
ncbi:MAG: hypothetical protein HOQ24_11675 [Mycobacteriaceae bacterium]|nr:hypothetical protein [Mycobacteriaceae bacterium]